VKADKVWFSTAEAAAYLEVSERTMRSWIAKGLIRRYKMGKFNRFHKRDLDAFIEEAAVEAANPPSA
jgi:excisionase family DNA binding protein